MSGELFVMLALGALLVFILWDVWRNRRSVLAKRSRAGDGFVPGGTTQEVASFVLAAVFLALGLFALYSPELDASGRRAYVFSLVEYFLGRLAGPALFFAGAIAAFVRGVFVRKDRLASKGGHAG